MKVKNVKHYSVYLVVFFTFEGSYTNVCKARYLFNSLIY